MLLPTTVHRLPRYRETNTAGGCRAQYIHVDDVVSDPVEVNGTVPDALVLVEGAVVYTVEPKLYSQQYGERSVDTQGATQMQCSMGQVISKDRAMLLGGLWELRQGRYLVINHDKNGTLKLIGTKSQPALVQLVQIQHGARPGADTNYYELRTTLTRELPAPFYLQEPPAIVEPGEGGTCPTVDELLAALSWAEIAGYLSPTQLSAAEAAICDVCETLPELMAARTWAELEVLLSPTQLAAAVASICDTCATLEELMGASTWEEIEALLTTTQRNAARVTINLRDTTPATIASYMAAAGSVANLTAPDGTIKTTDGVTTVGNVKSNGSANLPQSKIKYTTAAGGSAELAASNTEYASSTLRPATTVPRFTIYRADGSTVHSYKDIASPSYTRDEALKLSFEFASGDDTSLLYTVRSASAGAYLTLAQDGSSGTITIAKNGGSFVTFAALNYTNIVVGDTIQVKRTSYSGSGYVELNGQQA